MRFPLMFTRAKPASGTSAALGSDTAPPAAPYPNDKKPAAAAGVLGGDCLLATRMISNIGWPAHRLVVACRYKGVGAVTPVNVQVFFYEDSLGCWLSLGAAQSITPASNAGPGGAPVYFDTIVPTDYANTQASKQSPNPGNCEFLIIASDPGGGGAASNGEYDFAATIDQTTKL